MDKQKQIEEIADALYNSQYEYDLSNPFEVAKVVIDLGYRKIPEGAVVLMGTETEQRFEDLMVAFDEMGFMPNTTHPFPEEYVETWKQRLIFVFGQLRKEMAEKFAEKLKEKLCEFLEDNEDYNGKIDKGVCLIDVIGVTALDGEIISLGLIDEICKEITEGE